MANNCFVGRQENNCGRLSPFFWFPVQQLGVTRGATKQRLIHGLAWCEQGVTPEDTLQVSRPRRHTSTSSHVACWLATVSVAPVSYRS